MVSYPLYLWWLYADFVKRRKNPKINIPIPELVKTPIRVKFFSTHMLCYMLLYILLSSVEISNFKICYLAPNGLKFGSSRRIQRWYDRLRGPSGGREPTPWIGRPDGYPGTLSIIAMYRRLLSIQNNHVVIQGWHDLSVSLKMLAKLSCSFDEPTVS